MGTYNPSSSTERDSTPTTYLPESCTDQTLLSANMMMYVNSGSFMDTLAGNFDRHGHCAEIGTVEGTDSTLQHQDLSNLGEFQDFSMWREGGNEMSVMHTQNNSSGILDGEQNLQGQGLSLSLGTEIPSGMQLPSVTYRNMNLSLGNCDSRSQSAREEQVRDLGYVSTSFSVGNHDFDKGDLAEYTMMSSTRTISGSKYLKATQQLLEEVVNVRKSLKQPDKAQNQDGNDAGAQGPSGLKDDKNQPKDAPSDPQGATHNSHNELSHAERQALQNKLTKLLSMMDEVDRRYKQYYHQMQIVVSSFDMTAGCGAAKPYTTLALRTISRHFRCLRDAVGDQIQATRKSLGEKETSENGKGIRITRLRYVDQQLRQQRALQQLGMMHPHAWRPQRGLPESSISILRAWLFEHFLHPYPTDSDKIMLARQTGLSKSQVSNWFINARVRLWKPMVEDMYREETDDAEADTNSSSENANAATKSDAITSKDRGEETQRSSTVVGKCTTGQVLDFKSTIVSDIEMVGSTPQSNFHAGEHGEPVNEYGLLKLSEEQTARSSDCSRFPEAVIHSEGIGDRFMAAAVAAYQMSEVSRLGDGSRVSLTLGLQHCERGSIPMSGTMHHSIVSTRGDENYSTIASPVGAESTNFECLNSENRQNLFSSHLLHDFVAQNT